MRWTRREALMGMAGGLALGAGAAAGAWERDYLHSDPKAVQWFREARFGMFVHWGVYSLLGRGEWVMQNEGIPIAEYQKLPPQFNPTGFNAPAWVKMVKEAGIRYI